MTTETFKPLSYALVVTAGETNEKVVRVRTFNAGEGLHGYVQKRLAENNLEKLPMPGDDNALEIMRANRGMILDIASHVGGNAEMSGETSYELVDNGKAIASFPVGPAPVVPMNNAALNMTASI